MGPINDLNIKTDMKFIQLLILVFLSLMLHSCVSQMQYNRVNTEVSKLRTERDDAMKQAETSKIEAAKLEKENQSLVSNNQKLKEDSSASGMLYRKNKQLLGDLFDKYDRLDKSYNALLSNSSTERSFTEKDYLRKEQDLARREKELADAKSQYTQTQTELETKKEEAARLAKDVGSKDSQIKEMLGRISAKDKAIQDMKDKMNAALLPLNNSDMQVSEKEGKVYVTLPNKSLFASGGFSLQPKGKEAVIKIAQVLASNPDLDVSIEGHTDNTPFKPAPVGKPKKGAKKPAVKPASSSTIKDNWDLSSLRAASVAKVFYTYGIAGNRITSSGKGEFYPLDISNSEEAKARNRRIEIVISPKNSRLYELMNGK